MMTEMKPANLEDLHELSPVQQGFLFHSLLAPEAGVYLEQLTFTFNGILNLPAFKKTWQAVVDRHSSLRTAFYWQDLNKPLQAVYRHVVVAIEELDWRNADAAEQDQALETFLIEDRKKGFDLSQAPLMRFTLIRTGKEQWKFLVRFHHLIADGWSMGIILQEFVMLYKSFWREQNPSLPACRPYRDYIAWCRKQDVTKAELFWRAELEGLKTVPSLDLGSRTRTEENEPTHGKMDAQLQKWAEPLQAMARHHQLTVNTVVQGTWSLLLSRLTGEEDVVAGVTVAGRPPELPGSEGIVGVLINTLPVRTHAHGGDAVLPWLKKFQTQQIKRQQFGYASLVQIQEWSEIPARMPLFETLVVYENVPFPRLQLEEEGLEIPEARYDGRPHYALSFMVFPGLVLRVTYQRDRHSENTIRQILRHLEVFLADIIENPQQRIGELPLFTGDEQQQILTEYNQTQTEFPRQKCIHELFAEQVALTPEHTAVSYSGNKLTFRELDTRSNQLARHLLKRGIGPESAVGIYMERSLEMIIGLLGILKAGGAYVPLEPNYPQHRLTYMIEDSGINVILTQERLLASLPTQCEMLCLDKKWDLICSESEESPQNRVGPENLAYVIYTSGSTGIPKGVAVPHRGVVRLIKGTNYVRWQPRDVFLQLAPISFDASTLEIWGCLLNGGHLIVFPAGVPDLHELALTLRKEEVTVLWLTAGLFHQMVEQELDSLTGIRDLLAGGDVLSPSDVKSALEAGCHVINGYGPTENTTFTCCYRVTKENWQSDSVPIGKPIANTQVYVLDEEMQPVPAGVVGELYIGGAGLARGYWQQAGQTAEKFVPNAFAAQAGERLYRSGDLVRYREGGEIEFVGRRDEQVKVRGYRIELGEIESVLQEAEGVEQAAVVVGEEGGEKRLVAYVVRRKREDVERGTSGDGAGVEEGRVGGSGGEKEWRRHLQEKLPAYMVPSWYVELEKMPLSANGKVDRKALPKVEGLRRDKSYVPPRDHLELRLARIWEELFQIKPVGVKDNFFEIGGHSLLALRLTGRIRTQFGYRLPLAALFRNGTVEELARILRQEHGPQLESSLIPIQTGGPGLPLFFVHPIAGNVISYVDLSRHLGADQNFYGLEAAGLTSKFQPYTHLTELAAHYLREIQAVQPHGPYLLGGWSFGGVVAFEMAQQLLAQNEKVAALIILDSWAPLARSKPARFDDVTIMVHFATLLGAQAGRKLDVNSREIEAIPTDERFNYVCQQAKKFEILPPDIDIGAVHDLYSNVFYQNVLAIFDYEPQPYPEKITLLRASEIIDAEVLQPLEDPLHGWDELAPSRIETYEVPGDHFTIVREPNVKFLAACIKEVIQKSTGQKESTLKQSTS